MSEIGTPGKWNYKAHSEFVEISQQYKHEEFDPGLVNSHALLLLACEFIEKNCHELEWNEHCREYFRELWRRKILAPNAMDQGGPEIKEGYATDAQIKDTEKNTPTGKGGISSKDQQKEEE